MTGHRLTLAHHTGPRHPGEGGINWFPKPSCSWSKLLYCWPEKKQRTSLDCNTHFNLLKESWHTYLLFATHFNLFSVETLKLRGFLREGEGTELERKQRVSPVKIKSWVCWETSLKNKEKPNLLCFYPFQSSIIHEWSWVDLLKTCLLRRATYGNIIKYAWSSPEVVCGVRTT